MQHLAARNLRCWKRSTQRSPCRKRACCLPHRTLHMEFPGAESDPPLPSRKRNQLDVFVTEFRRGEKYVARTLLSCKTLSCRGCTLSRETFVNLASRRFQLTDFDQN